MKPATQEDGRHRVLIVEDDPAQSQTLSDTFEHEGFSVAVSQMADEAMERITSGKFSVAVVDLRLPGLSGIDLIQRMRSAGSRTRVVIHTAYGAYDSAGDALNLGAFAYVEKLSDPQELISHVHRAVEDSLQHELQASEAKYKAQFEQALDGIVLADAETGIIIDCNDAMSELVGRGRTELIGEHQRILHPPEDTEGGYSRTFKKHLEDPHGKSLETRVVTKDGETRDVSIKVNEMHIGGRTVFQGIFRDVTERRQAEDALHQSAADLRALAGHLQDVREEERATLARELHDNFGQNLTGLQIDLAWLDRHLQSANPGDLATAQDRIAAMVPLVERLSEMTQTISASLRPGVLDELGLVAAIEWHASDFETRTGLPCAVSLPANDIELDQNIALALFRIMQEVLTNVIRHAQATRAEIRLHTVGSELELEIQDNGQGFAPDSISGPKALGVLGMRERAAAFGGTVDLLSEPGRGTTVRVRMPAA